MKRVFLFLSFVLISYVSFCFGVYDSVPQKRDSVVVVYAYDSFAAEWGAGPVLKKRFEQLTGLSVVIVSAGDGAQVLSKAVSEKKSPQADILLGIDNNQYAAAKSMDILVPYKAAGIDDVPSEFYFESDTEKAVLTPFDWSSFAFMYDSSDSVFANGNVPTCLQDLTDKRFYKKIIILDPRLSTPGLGLFTWVQDVYGDAADDFWRSLKPNVLTMSPSWDIGYGMFTSGEAPLVISYTTSAPYHEMGENTTRFKAAVFSDGHINQIEGAGIVKNCANLAGAKQFLDFLLSAEAQQELFCTQWMFPVSKQVSVPPAFAECSKNITFRSGAVPVTSQSIEHTLSILAD